MEEQIEEQEFSWEAMLLSDSEGHPDSDSEGQTLMFSQTLKIGL